MSDRRRRRSPELYLIATSALLACVCTFATAVNAGATTGSRAEGRAKPVLSVECHLRDTAYGRECLTKRIQYRYASSVFPVRFVITFPPGVHVNNCGIFSSPRGELFIGTIGTEDKDGPPGYLQEIWPNVKHLSPHLVVWGECLLK